MADGNAAGASRRRRLSAEPSRSAGSSSAVLTCEPDPEGSTQKVGGPLPASSTSSQSGRHEVLIGRTLGGFRIDRVLGAGAMGTVFLAEQLALRRPVALKVLKESRSRSADHLARFMREAQAVARLVHQNAVQVYSVGQEGGVHFLALEYVDGQSLGEVLASRGRLPWRAALEIARQAAQSLVRAHEMGIVHRDIKPENILINRHADVKVADFGLAMLDGEAAITEHGTILGTPRYMSPEQAQGGHVGPPADLYALGCTLYHMLTGSPPFDGDDAITVLVRQIGETPRAPNEVVNGLPETVSRLVMKLLAKLPEKRPASARALVGAIQRVRRLADAAPAQPAAPAAAGTVREGEAAYAPPQPEQLDRIRAVALSPDGMRELLAFEATRACLSPRPRRAFLEATMRNYRIPAEQMLCLMDREVFTRDDIWELQALKRRAQGNQTALQAIAQLRRLEADLGRSLLQECIGSRKQSSGSRTA